MTPETTNQNLVITPKGTLLFGALKVPFTSKVYPQKDEKTGQTIPMYEVRVDFNTSDAGVTEFAQIVKEVNPKKVITTNKAGTIEDGHFHFIAKSRYQPLITLNGTELKGDDIPYFDGRFDTATVELLLKPDDSGSEGTFRLIQVNILDLKVGDRPEGFGQRVSIDTLRQKANS